MVQPANLSITLILIYVDIEFTHLSLFLSQLMLVLPLTESHIFVLLLALPLLFIDWNFTSKTGNLISHLWKTICQFIFLTLVPFHSLFLSFFLSFSLCIVSKSGHVNTSFYARCKTMYTSIHAYTWQWKTDDGQDSEYQTCSVSSIAGTIEFRLSEGKEAISNGEKKRRNEMKTKLNTLGMVFHSINLSTVQLSIGCPTFMRLSVSLLPTRLSLHRLQLLTVFRFCFCFCFCFFLPFALML